MPDIRLVHCGPGGRAGNAMVEVLVNELTRLPQLRRLLRASIAAVVFTTTLPAGACLLLNNYTPFARDTPATFDWDEAALDPALPAPRVRVVRIDRAPREPADYASRVERCTMGMALLQVRWPGTGGPPMKEVGFRFRKLKDGAIFFDAAPQQGTIRGTRMEYGFSIFESAADAARDLDMEIEVYAVNRDRERGRGTRVRIHAPPAPQR
jgi:hypothetical protein